MGICYVENDDVILHELCALSHIHLTLPALFLFTTEQLIYVDTYFDLPPFNKNVSSQLFIWLEVGWLF